MMMCEFTAVLSVGVLYVRNLGGKKSTITEVVQQSYNTSDTHNTKTALACSNFSVQAKFLSSRKDFPQNKGVRACIQAKPICSTSRLGDSSLQE